MIAEHEKPPVRASLKGTPFPTVRRVFPWLLLFLACLHIAGLNGFWWHTPDSALYLALARSLAEDGVYEWNLRPHTYVWPGFPGLLAVLRAMGIRSFLALNSVIAVFALACVGIACPLYQCVFGSQKKAAVALLLFGTSASLFYYSRYILTDVPFTFLVLCGLYCGLQMNQGSGRRSWLWTAAAALVVGLGVFVRPPGPLLGAALVAGLWLRRGSTTRWRTRLLKTTLLVLPALVAWSLWMYRCAAVTEGPPGSYYQTFFRAARTERYFSYFIHRAGQTLDFLGRTVGGADLDELGGVVLLAVALVGVAECLRRGRWEITLFGVFYAIGLFRAAPTRRYLLPILPIILIWLLEGSDVIAGYMLEKMGWVTEKRLRVTAYVMLGGFLTANLYEVTSVILEARSPRFYQEYKDGALLHHRALAAWLESNAAPASTVLAHRHRLLHYLTGLETWRASRRYIRRLAPDPASALVKAKVGYVVINSDEPDHQPDIKRLILRRPGLFERIGKFGSLDLYGVRLEAIRQEGVMGPQKGAVAGSQ